MTGALEQVEQGNRWACIDSGTELELDFKDIGSRLKVMTRE